MLCSLIMRTVRWVRTTIETLLAFLVSCYWEKKRALIPDVKNKHWFLRESAVTLARMIRERELTSETLVQAVIDRIREVNPILNATVDDRFEHALAEARNIDNLISIGRTGNPSEQPFLGVPFTTKESQSVKGLSLTYGLWSRRNERASEDCTAVQRLRRAGAIPLAVTNLPELLIWSETRNTVYGVTKNPHHCGRTPGGSSGAEGALMASYATVIGLSSDVAGSTRIPSLFCGQIGYHPTAGVVNLKGLFNRDGGNEEDSMFSFGFISKHVEDQMPLLRVIAGEKASMLDLDEDIDIQDINVYYTSAFRDIWMSPLRSEMKDAMDRVIKKLETDVNDENKPKKYYHEGFSSICSLWRYWMCKEPEDYFKLYTNGNGTPYIICEAIKKFLGFSKHSLFVIMRLLGLRFWPSMNSEKAEKLTRDMKAEIFNKLGSNGVLLIPSAPTSAPYHYFTYLSPYNFGYFALANVLKCPAVQVPIGTDSKGLPIGIQILAAPRKDALCLTVAKYLEQQFGGAIMACKVNAPRDPRGFKEL